MNKQGRVELLVFIFPSRCLVVEAQSTGCWKRHLWMICCPVLVPLGCHQAVLEAQQLLCHQGLLGVMAVPCWTGGSHDGLLLSHHLVPATRRGDWHKSICLHLGKQMVVFKYKQGSVRDAALTGWQWAGELLCCLSWMLKEVTNTWEHLWEHWKSKQRLEQDKGDIFPYCLCELGAEITVRDEMYSAFEDMQATHHPRQQLVVSNHLQASRRQEAFKLLSQVSFWISEPWEAGGSNGIFHSFCWWSRFASCLLNIASKCVCRVKVSIFELVSGVREQKNTPWQIQGINSFLCPVLSRTSRTFVFEWKIKVKRKNSLWGAFSRTLIFLCGVCCLKIKC